MAELAFRHEVIDDDPPGAHIDITLIADVDGDDGYLTCPFCQAEVQVPDPEEPD